MSSAPLNNNSLKGNSPYPAMNNKGFSPRATGWKTPIFLISNKTTGSQGVDYISSLA
jgi:hypothetical protein